MITVSKEGVIRFYDKYGNYSINNSRPLAIWPDGHKFFHTDNGTRFENLRKIDK